MVALIVFAAGWFLILHSVLAIAVAAEAGSKDRGLAVHHGAYWQYERHLRRCGSPLPWFGTPLLVVFPIANLFLLGQLPFLEILVVQAASCMLVIRGYLMQNDACRRWAPLPLYIGLSNLAVVFGLAKVFRRRRAATWQPGGRTDD